MLVGLGLLGSFFFFEIFVGFLLEVRLDFFRFKRSVFMSFRFWKSEVGGIFLGV